VAEALACWRGDPKLLLLSERKDHIAAIYAALAEEVPNLFLLHGRLSAQLRSATLHDGVDDDLNLIAFPQTVLPQAIGCRLGGTLHQGPPGLGLGRVS
jgi:hypothetical protein